MVVRLINILKILRIVLEGKIELDIDGERYYIPSGVKHSGKIYARYADITFLVGRTYIRKSRVIEIK